MAERHDPPPTYESLQHMRFQALVNVLKPELHRWMSIDEIYEKVKHLFPNEGKFLRWINQRANIMRKKVLYIKIAATSDEWNEYTSKKGLRTQYKKL